MTEQVKITILGYHGYGNSGDEAILLAIRNNIKKLGYNTKLTVLSFNPEKTRKVYGINAIYRFNIFSIINEIRKTDILLAGGGTLLQDETSTRSLMYYLSIINLAKFFRKKVMLYGNGIGPVNYNFNKKLIKKVINKVDIVTLRDIYSKEELSLIGVEKAPLYVTADPVFSLDENYVDGEKLLANENIPMDKPILGISIRKWKKEKDFLIKLNDFVKYILDKYDMNVLLIPMQHSMDMEISKELFGNLNSDKVFLLKESYLPEEILSIIGKLNMLVSMRLHTLIFAGVKRVPLAGLVYDPKVSNYLQLLNMPSLGDVENLDIDFMKNKIDEMLCNRDEYLLKLEKSSNTLMEAAKENDYYLLNIIKSLKE